MKKLLLITITMLGFALSNVYSQQITNKADIQTYASNTEWVLNFTVGPEIQAARISIPGYGVFGVSPTNNCIRVPSSINPLKIVLKDYMGGGYGSLQVNPANPYTPVDIIHYGKQGEDYTVELRGYYWTENYVINITILPY